MNKKIIVASNNEHKIKEIKEILNKFNIEVKSQKDENINMEIEETGKNFMENAYLKAKSIYEIRRDAMVLADDSGLMVDALDGAPGIYSARFAGEHGNSEKNNEKLLELLKGEANRNAKFVCSMVLIVNDEKIIKVEGSIEGTIIDEKKGENGFGYDPLFYVQEYKKTFAQMDSNLKNSISHRGKALNKLEKEIEKLLQEE